MNAQALEVSKSVGDLIVRQLTTWRGFDYCLLYRGTEQALLTAGIIREAWIPGRPGANKYSISVGRGHERITVRRLSKLRLEVRLFHPPRPALDVRVPSPTHAIVPRPALTLVAGALAHHATDVETVRNIPAERPMLRLVSG